MHLISFTSILQVLYDLEVIGRNQVKIKSKRGQIGQICKTVKTGQFCKNGTDLQKTGRTAKTKIWGIFCHFFGLGKIGKHKRKTRGQNIFIFGTTQVLGG